MERLWRFCTIEIHHDWIQVDHSLCVGANNRPLTATFQAYRGCIFDTEDILIGLLKHTYLTLFEHNTPSSLCFLSSHLQATWAAHPSRSHLPRACPRAVGRHYHPDCYSQSLIPQLLKEYVSTKAVTVNLVGIAWSSMPAPSRHLMLY